MIPVAPPPASPTAGLTAPADFAPGFSPEANTISGMVRAAIAQWLESVDVRGPLLEALGALNDVCQEEGPLGRPVDPAAWSAARRFLMQMPSSWPMPDISVDADNEVALDWDFGWRRGMALSIGPTGRIHYAWTSGSDEAHGAAWVEHDGISPAVAGTLARLSEA